RTRPGTGRETGAASRRTGSTTRGAWCLEALSLHGRIGGAFGGTMEYLIRHGGLLVSRPDRAAGSNTTVERKRPGRVSPPPSPHQGGDDHPLPGKYSPPQSPGRRHPPPLPPPRPRRPSFPGSSAAPAAPSDHRSGALHPLVPTGGTVAHGHLAHLECQ